jgi:DNA repair exonuclease SbcCD ATPase subunit
MLNRIVIINSQLFSKASILISDSTGIQLAAESNIGKSSLINTLNFLYIIDKGKMRFEGDKTLKESIPHYFKNINQSYILFEIFKDGYWCLLVRANANNDIEYYKIDHEFKDEFFFRDEDGKQSIINFQDVQANFLTNNIGFSEVQSENLYDLVYSESKKSKAVVWITDNVKRRGRGLNNSFTRIYHYLLKSSDIRNETFKESLLIADNKQEKLEVFADRSKDEITELEQKQNKISRLKTIGNEYLDLKQLIDEFKSKEKICCKLKYNFNKQFGLLEKELSEKVSDTSELSIAIRTIETTINEVLEKEKINLYQQITRTESEIENIKKSELKPVEDILEEIKPYGEKGSLQYSGLENEIEQLTNKYKALFIQLNTITHYNLTEEQVINEISSLKSQKLSVDNKIENFGNLLYQKISKDKKVRAKIYSLLSKQVLEQSEVKILDTVSKTESVLKLFDGKIDISDIHALEKDILKTKEELQGESDNLKKKIDEQEGILKVIKDEKKKKTQLANFKTDLEHKEYILKKVKRKPELLIQKIEIEKRVSILDSSITEIKNLILKKETEITSKKEELERVKRQKETLEGKLKIYRKWNESINSYYEYFEVEESTDIEFEKIFDKFDDAHKSLSRVKELIYGTQGKKGSFQIVSQKLEKDTNDLFEFVREVDEELSNLKQLENNTTELLELISHKFTKPTSSFLQRYNEFKNFIRSFNKQLEDFPVSNIKKISIKVKDVTSLTDDLENISNIGSLLSSDLSILKKYFSEGKIIEFKQLFELILEIEKNDGTKEKVDLSKQVESNATNRVLKLFLFLSIIKELAVNNTENKIAIYIDELGTIGPHNVKQIIKFCSKFNFIPIFAAPREIEGIEKYYIIKPSSKGGGIIVDERHTKTALYKNANAAVL